MFYSVGEEDIFGQQAIFYMDCVENFGAIIEYIDSIFRYFS